MLEMQEFSICYICAKKKKTKQWIREEKGFRQMWERETKQFQTAGSKTYCANAQDFVIGRPGAWDLYTPGAR